VFYFDRAEASSLLLASKMRKRGALVFFEPSSCKDVRIFSACMAVSDVVKYSAQRISEPPQNPDDPSPRLEIQTLGESGLRFRIKRDSNHPGSWQHLPSYPVSDFKDTTGCGDWCSAGFLHHVGKNGRASFLKLSADQIIAGLRFGQALSAVNCGYEGARGPMYVLSRAELLEQATAILKT
jgi:fructokinase